MQKNFNFMGIIKAPENAPSSMVRKMTGADQAVRVSIKTKGLKLDYYADQMHVSRAYISMIANGIRAVPEWFVEPFCTLTGTNLLKQYLELHNALLTVSGELTPEQAEMMMAKELRAAA